MKATKKLLAAAMSAALALGALPLSASAAMTGPPASIVQMYERIAEWENVSLDDCFTEIGGLWDAKLITPNKMYFIDVYKDEWLRVTVKAGTVLTPEDVSNAWRDYLIATGDLEGAYGLDETPIVTETETKGTYLVKMDEVWRHGVYIFPDSLTTIPHVEKIEGQYRYHTDSRPNHVMIYCLRFQCDFTPTAEDFPELDVADISYSDRSNTWELVLPYSAWDKSSYPDYFAAYAYMRSLDFVHDVKMGWITTELADASEDATIRIDEYEPVFYRGDLNKDGQLDIRDAVWLARLTAEDNEIPVEALGLANADADGDGLVTLRDITAVLEKIAAMR